MKAKNLKSNILPYYVLEAAAVAAETWEPKTHGKCSENWYHCKPKSIGKKNNGFNPFMLTFDLNGGCPSVGAAVKYGIPPHDMLQHIKGLSPNFLYDIDSGYGFRVAANLRRHAMEWLEWI